MTPPLVTGPPGRCPCHCALTPHTSYGFDVIDFARDVLEMPLDPWQELAAIHIGELLEDGRPRFRVVLILVARQNGKTLLAKVLVLYWLIIDKVPAVLNTSTDRTYAKRFWTSVCQLALNNRWIKKRLARAAVRLTIGEEALVTKAGAELKFAANNGSAGRSMTLWRWLCDELREHRDRTAWDAASNAQNAVAAAQTVCITNQGDDSSVVLDSLREPALDFIETGRGDPRRGLLEWSGPDGAEPDDLEALAQANPNMGRGDHGPDPDALLGAALSAKRNGGEELSGFTTEIMCRRVDLLDPAIEPTLWAAAALPLEQRIDLGQHRDRVALCLDVSMQADHATLTAAALIDGVIYIDVVAAWDGPGCTSEVRRDLPGHVARILPRTLGWFPTGPAAVIAAELKSEARWKPPRRPNGRRVEVEPITTDTPAAAMSLAELVRSLEVRHYDDPLQNTQVRGAQRLRQGDRWTFVRRGRAPVDACYSMAGATWLARTMPPPPPPLESA